MERLTKKYAEKDYDYNCTSDMLRFTETQSLIKLGQLEDIEEELGIELSVLFKAMKGCYYKTNTKLGIVKGTLCNIGRHYEFQGKDTECLIVYDGGSMFVKLSDYGKLFALTKEELEK